MFEALKDRVAQAIDEDIYKQYSVMVPLIRKEDGIYVLFEQRASRLKRQPGEICFPGGGRDPGETPLENAVREQLEIHPFIADCLYLIVSENNPLAAQETVTLEQVLGQRLFMPGRTSSANMFLVKAVTSAGYQLPDFVECQSIMNAFNFVSTGSGASVLSGHVSESYMRPGMKKLRIVPEIATYTAVITRKELLKRPLVNEFIRFFLERQE